MDPISIIMAVAALGAGVMSGISTVKSAKAQAKAVEQQTQEKINERARTAKKLMSQQKTSFLKSGVYFNGTPEDVINETYNTSITDINTLKNNALTNIKNLQSQANAGFTTSIIKGVASAAFGLAGAGLAGASATSSASGGWLTARDSVISGIKGFGHTGDIYSNIGGIA